MALYLAHYLHCCIFHYAYLHRFYHLLLRSGMYCLKTVLAVLLICSQLSSLSLSAQSFSQRAIQHMASHRKDFALKELDVQSPLISDQYTSAHNGISHVYLQQQLDGIPILNAIASVHLDANGSVVYASSTWEADIQARKAQTQPDLGPQQAVQLAGDFLELGVGTPKSVTMIGGQRQRAFFLAEKWSDDSIQVQLIWEALPDGPIHLCWEVQIYLKDKSHWWNVRVDSYSGEIVSQNDWVNDACNHTHGTPSYRVYPFPSPSPLHREDSLVQATPSPEASPFGWHDTDGIIGPEHTTTKGNNVDAYSDSDRTNAPTGGDLARADGGTSMNFDFPVIPTAEPPAYREASVTNLFYWTNQAHDIFYRFGFDEVSGNFQQNNYGKGGLPGDPVMAEAQDSAFVNNANFATPPDGLPGRMQMFFWNQTTPSRDAALDAEVIIHEFAHGLSNRLVAGPSQVGCLTHQEQMGEGWSDWLALMLTMQSGDLGTDARGIGNYVQGKPINGSGVRPLPYSTDMSINGFTYGNLGSYSVPHGVGFGWATILWDMSWAMIDQYGFDPDWYQGNGGNQLAMQLVVDGMKLLGCQPGFVDARDAILQADKINNGGANQCLLWEVFARRGLGYSASQGGSNLVADADEAFDLPPDCSKKLIVTIESSPDSLLPVGQLLTVNVDIANYRDTLINDISVHAPLPEGLQYVANSASHGGFLQNDQIQFPVFDLPSGDKRQLMYQLTTTGNQFTQERFHDDQESGTTNWTRTHAVLGTYQSDWNWINFFPYSGNRHWFASGVSYASDQYLQMSIPYLLNDQSSMTFWHRFFTEAGTDFGYDGGVLEYSLDNGMTWLDMGSMMTANGYNRIIASTDGSPLSGRAAFSGVSNLYQLTIVDLSSLAGTQPLIRFRFATDENLGMGGWYLDDVYLYDMVSARQSVYVSVSATDSVCQSMDAPGLIVVESNSFPVEYLDLQATAQDRGIELHWVTSTEENNRGFTIERGLSSDLRLFSPIGWLDGAGTTNSPQEYTFLDTEVSAGRTYAYRLRQEDISGAISYSPIVHARMGLRGQADLSLFPNPAQNTVNVQAIGDFPRGGRIFLLNALGQEVQQSLLRSNQQRQEINWDLTDLPTGWYVVYLQAGEQIAHQRLWIQE
ncbi:MAG: M36 family metallopeptidase [Bacteroidota bacterium]